MRAPGWAGSRLSRDAQKMASYSWYRECGKIVEKAETAAGAADVSLSGWALEGLVDPETIADRSRIFFGLAVHSSLASK